MHGALPLLEIMFHSPGPGCALDVNEHPGFGILELHHDDGLQVAQLVPVREEVCWESSPRCIRHCAYVFLVRIIFTVTMQPHHVELGTSLLQGMEERGKLLMKQLSYTTYYDTVTASTAPAHRYSYWRSSPAKYA